MKKEICPNCNGLGTTKSRLRGGAIYNECGHCLGKGKVSSSKKKSMLIKMPYLSPLKD